MAGDVGCCVGLFEGIGNLGDKRTDTFVNVMGREWCTPDGFES